MAGFFSLLGVVSLAYLVISAAKLWEGFGSEHRAERVEALMYWRRHRLPLFVALALAVGVMLYNAG